MTAELAAQNTLEKGTLIAGRYRIERLLGQGGMGAVYAAVNTKSGRQVAIKIVRDVVATAEQKRRFMREAKATNAIGHEHVVDVLDVFEDDEGSPVMVMELLEGETLRQHLRREGKLALEVAACILAPVCSALAAAHDKGIVHRDLKPDNIFLARGATGSVVPKVLDFGIARVMDPSALVAETQGGHTHTGALLGTPHYMSFEQAMSEKDIDNRSDIWSMGVITFEALAGRRPLEFSSLGQMYTQLIQSEVPKIREHVSDLPDEVADVVDRCLVKEREGRLDDIRVLLGALEPHASTTIAAAPVPVHVTKPPPTRRTWWWWALGGAAASAAVGVAALRGAEAARVESLPSFDVVVSPTAASSESAPPSSSPPAPSSAAPTSSARVQARSSVPVAPSASASAAPASSRGGLIEGDPYRPSH